MTTDIFNFTSFPLAAYSIPMGSEEAKQDDGSYVAFFFFAPMILSVGYILFMWIRSKHWENNILPKYSEKSDLYFMRAYLCLAVLLIKKDPLDHQQKLYLLKKEISEKTKSSINFSELLKTLMEKDVRVKHVAKWANFRLTPQEREDLLYFLIHISYVDGKLISSEHEILQDIANLFDISPKQFQRMIAIQKQRILRERAKNDQRQREQQKKTRSFVSRKSQKEKAFEILGISPHASMEEIKKVYRQLVKKYHPDRYAGKEESVIEMAQSRFIEIQQAYERICDK